MEESKLKSADKEFKGMIIHLMCSKIYHKNINMKGRVIEGTKAPHETT